MHYGSLSHFTDEIVHREKRGGANIDILTSKRSNHSRFRSPEDYVLVRHMVVFSYETSSSRTSSPYLAHDLCDVECR